MKSLQDSQRDYLKLKRMQSIILGMRESSNNVMQLKEKKAPARAHTTKNVMDLLSPKKKQIKAIAEKPEIIVENDSDAKSASLDSDSDRSVKHKDPNYVDIKRESIRRNGKTQALSPRGQSPDIVAQSTNVASRNGVLPVSVKSRSKQASYQTD